LVPQGDYGARRSGGQEPASAPDDSGENGCHVFQREQIGETEGREKPPRLLRTGEAGETRSQLISIRNDGSDGHVGMFDFDNPDKQYVQISGCHDKACWTWSYQPGPDLSALPTTIRNLEAEQRCEQPTVLFNSMIDP